MPTKYCAGPGCGEKIVYSTTPPTKCPSCGYVMAQAFQVAVAQIVAAPRFSPPQSRFVPSAPTGDEADDHFDSYEVQANARLLTQQIDSADFLVSHEPEPKLKVRDVITIVSTPPPTRAAPKSRAPRRSRK